VLRTSSLGTSARWVLPPPMTVLRTAAFTGSPRAQAC
jgi:hypothetical protein